MFMTQMGYLYSCEFFRSDAKNIIIREKGTHFDPEIIDAFMVLENKFYKISLEYTEYL